MQERMFRTEGNVSSYCGEGEKDIWKAYVRRGMNSEKGQMKLRLLDWGCTVERCRRLQEELRRLEEPEGTENAFLQEEFKAERARLEGRLAEIWREKKRMDALLAGLEENEQEYIRLRFEKGYGLITSAGGCISAGQRCFGCRTGFWKSCGKRRLRLCETKGRVY